MKSIHVTVLLFAAHRELLGESRREIDLPAGATLADLYSVLEGMEPRFSQLRRSTTFAVNRQVVPETVSLSGGEEVALLQPVSGGTR